MRAIGWATTLLVLAAGAPAARGACPAAPRPACRTAVETKLKLVRPGDPEKDRLTWSFSRGPATTQAELGDPTATTTWSLCGWDPGGLRFAIDVPPGGTCGGKPCWAAQGTTGWRYKDAARAVAGVQSVKLAGSTSAHMKASVEGRGPLLPDPALPLAAPFTVQLVRDDGRVCFEGIYDAASFTQSLSTAVQAKAKVVATTRVPALPSAGCGQPITLWTPGASTDDQLDHDGLTRTFRVHLPPSYDGLAPMPVVLLLHGGFGSGAQIEGTSNLLDVADATGFVVVSPDGTASPGGIRTWNAGLCCGPSVGANVDDVGFVAAIVDRLEANGCIDRRRVYATGMSNGAMLAHRLACDLADRIRAIVPVSGVDETTSCAPARPVPVLEVHGTGDRHVPFDGGMDCGASGVSYVSVPNTIARWASRDGCHGKPFTSLQQGDGTCTRQGTCDAGTDVDLCVIPNGGHQWPGGDPPAIPGINGCPFGYQSETFAAPDVLWNFFATHPVR